MKVKFDHCVIHVSDWETSNIFYQNVLGAELIPNGKGWMYRFGDVQLNLHGPGLNPTPVAQLPVRPGNSDVCFEWQGTTEEAKAHLEQHNIAIELGPVPRFGAKGHGTSLYFRDPDGSLLEFIVYEKGSVN
jgi:catechol 2,3-dioxygenase-like lactoylglutathione lyase family enzyme